ncbi:protein phosphatase 2C domain-containing protein [Trichocoleus sp. FACHB-591]|uniref:PP2C family protein-serine/threonine phosphatase n=1 Tax=Trichocoleus sp. FACHB-591 TaxID=2692872 RepID=UPI001688664C|nr:protein phosphatase 2C domain-containing protein [Trichocoleus sp. FACHB-591]MBD2098509.1 protein phosphatase 2C domain-containing protein [Trichocoleus sp. FACHB-591]
MSNSELKISCPNLACANPQNSLGQKLCAHCETPLIYRYLWASGSSATQRSPQELVLGRYYVLTPQIWLDTQPGLLPHLPPAWPDELLAYLHLYPQRLHVPELYGFASSREEATQWDIVLLDNAAIDSGGSLHPSMAEVWPQTTSLRQVYWLWQLLQLWQPLAEQGVASSLMIPENLRVEGWRVRLRELYADQPESDAQPRSLLSRKLPQPPTLEEFGEFLFAWASEAQVVVAQPLQTVLHPLRTAEASLASVVTQLNQLLLEQSSQLPLQLKLLGESDTGKQRSLNEDAYFPTVPDLREGQARPKEKLVPHLAIVCDGIGGHEGGEVASQLAVRSLKLQIRAFLTEVEEQEELLSPELIMEQLEAAIRVVNNLICAQNDTQGRESRQRMGTTLVMALQLPQRVKLTTGATADNAHELYIANVGDSRAYWITPHYCHLLTLDDDVATREVRLGRSLYREALHRPDAGGLTQALGTRDAEFLRPTVQRFIVEEDGLLLLCSDGLSDNGLIERAWVDYAEPVLRGKLSLSAAVQALIDLANQHNGYDNTSVVLMHCRVSSDFQLNWFDPKRATNATSGWPADMSEASKALLYGESDEAETPATAAPVSTVTRKRNRFVVVLSLLILLAGGGTAGLIAWSQLNPQGFQQLRQRLPNPLNQALPPGSPTN